AGCSSVVLHPEFAQRRTAIRHIALVSPNVEFHCQAPKARQDLPDHAAALRKELVASITRELNAKGLAVEFPPWRSLALATNVTREALARLEAIDRAGERTNFYTFIRWRDPKERTAPQQNEDVRLLAQMAAADTIAFVQLNGYTNTAEQQ